MDATAGSVVWTLVGGVVTLAIFSFLYKDNPLYKLAEHVAVGVSVGFLMVNYYYTVFMPKVWDNVVHKGQFDYLIPLILGLLLYSRFVPKWGWVSRLSLAFLLGAGSGMSIAPSLESRVLKQIEGTMASLVVWVPGDAWGTILQTLVSVFLVGGTIACLVFFLFSVEHKGKVGKLAYFGRLCIMAGFGASFGYTVMARVSLLIGRIQFLTQDWWKAIGQLFS
jgi:hypothetical protein